MRSLLLLLLATPALAVTPAKGGSLLEQVPQAALALELQKHLVFKSGWNFYDYGESSAPRPTLPL